MKGIFTTVKVINGVPLFLEKHGQRLAKINDKRLIPIQSGLKIKDIEEQIQRFIKIQHISNSALRINILENGEISYAVRDLPQDGAFVKAVTIVPSSPIPQIKQIDRRIYEQAEEYAKENGAETAIFKSFGFLLESTISNIISLDENEGIITPLLMDQGYKGVTREVLLEQGYIKEKEISIDTSGPLVLINSLRVQGVTELDGRMLNDPGDLMKNIRKIIQNSFEYVN